MPKLHTLEKGTLKAEVGNIRFAATEIAVAGCPGVAGVPCWLCGKPIGAGHGYYIIEVHHPGDTALVHAEEVE